MLQKKNQWTLTSAVVECDIGVAHLPKDTFTRQLSAVRKNYGCLFPVKIGLWQTWVTPYTLWLRDFKCSKDLYCILRVVCPKDHMRKVFWGLASQAGSPMANRSLVSCQTKNDSETSCCAQELWETFSPRPRCGSRDPTREQACGWGSLASRRVWCGRSGIWWWCLLVRCPTWRKPQGCPTTCWGGQSLPAGVGTPWDFLGRAGWSDWGKDSLAFTAKTGALANWPQINRRKRTDGWMF